MSKYKVKLIYKQEYEIEVEAHNESEAEGKAINLVNGECPVDSYLDDSEVKEIE